MEDEPADVWYCYESEGLDELRMDERFDSNANGHLDAGDGWRVVRYTVHGPGQIAHELRETRYTYFGATNVPLATTTFYYHFDRLGNVLALSDDSGDLLETYTTDAFGVDQADWSQDAYTLRRITGKEYDPDVGLYFFEARWYEPTVGRFCSGDPAESPPTSFPIGRNNPLLFADPTGAFDVAMITFDPAEDRALIAITEGWLKIHYSQARVMRASSPSELKQLIRIRSTRWKGCVDSLMFFGHGDPGVLQVGAKAAVDEKDLVMEPPAEDMFSERGSATFYSCEFAGDVADTPTDEWRLTGPGWFGVLGVPVTGCTGNVQYSSGWWKGWFGDDPVIHCNGQWLTYGGEAR